MQGFVLAHLNRECDRECDRQYLAQAVVRPEVDIARDRVAVEADMEVLTGQCDGVAFRSS